MSAEAPIPFSQIKARPVEFIWRDRLPKGMVTVIAGRRDQGKGLCAAHIAADISKAGGNVLYSAFEDDPALMTLPRLVAAGADVKRVLNWRFQLPKDFKELKARIIANKIDLVIMDPFASHLSGGVSRGGDGVRIVTDAMSALGEQTGVTFLIIEHMIKRVGRYSDPGDAVVGGSSGLPSAARAMYLFGVDPKDPDRRLLAPAKLNVRDWPKAIAFETDVEDLDVGEIPFLVMQGEADAAAHQLFDSARAKGDAHRPPDKRTATAEWLARYLFDAKKPVKAKTVREDARQYGLTMRTLRRAADDMGVIRKPSGGGVNCTWELNPQAKKAIKVAIALEKKQKEGSK
jgi:hypothetical protein